MDKAKQKFFNDYLEVTTFFVFILILLVIYIPSLIWEEEDMYKEESRFRMQTVYNVENFHNILTGSYQPDGKKAVTLVNAVRDSVMADSTFLGEQTVKLNGEEFLVDVPKGFDVEYDTTFGLRRISKETIIDTTVTVLMDVEGVEDTVYVQKKNLFDTQQDPSFLGIIEENTFERIETVTYYNRNFAKLNKPLADDSLYTFVDIFINDLRTKPAFYVSYEDYSNLLKEADEYEIELIEKGRKEIEENIQELITLVENEKSKIQKEIDLIEKEGGKEKEENIQQLITLAENEKSKIQKEIKLLEKSADVLSYPEEKNQFIDKGLDDLKNESESDNHVLKYVYINDSISDLEEDKLFISLSENQDLINRELKITINKKNLSDFEKDPLFIRVVDNSEMTMPATDYNFTSLPNPDQFFCPLTGDPYIIDINAEGNSVRVSSPILRPYRDNRYGFFALKTRSHGYIIDGTRSWDN